MSRAFRRIHARLAGLLSGADVGWRTELHRTSLLKLGNGGAIRIGRDCRIHAYTLIDASGGTITIGDRCSLNPFSVLYGHGGLTIGNDVRIAANVTIVAANHGFDDISIPIRRQPLSRKGIVIEDDVWIGSGARILDGVTVARGTIVAAGAVLTRSTEPFGIYGGVPARLLRFRGNGGD